MPLGHGGGPGWLVPAPRVMRPGGQGHELQELDKEGGWE